MNQSLQKFTLYALVFATPLLYTKQPITLFCHGIIDNKSQINRYVDFINQPAQTFDFSDAQIPADWDLNTLIYQSTSLFGKRVNRNNMYMGTGQDIVTLREHIDPSKSYILYGFSRGGAAAINYLAQDNPKNVQALILEATPADMIDAIDTFQQSIGYKITQDRTAQEQIFHTLFPAYQIASTPPVANIANITNKNLPVLIIQSRNDSRVPIDAAYKLYLAFLDAGFTDVYLCILDHGQHAWYTQGTNKNLYLQALHSFYKTYGFVYNQDFATIEHLGMLQPNKQEIVEMLQLHQQNLELNYHVQKLFNQKIALLAAAGFILFGLNWQLQFKNFKKS